MYIEFAEQDDAKARLRRRRIKRRALISDRKKRASHRSRIPMIIASICMIIGLTGYIGAHDGSISDTGLAFAAHAEEKLITENVVVKSGDTLWGIASAYSEPSKDIRKLVREICKINGIDQYKIYPGQVIKVPVKP